MRTQRPDLVFIGLIFLVLLLAAGATWLAQTYIIPLGGNEVFAPVWEAARYASTQEAGNPYLPEAVSRANLLLEDNSAPARFLYPYYSLVLFGPISLIARYSVARSVWMTFNLICMIGLTFTGLVLTRWRPKFWATLVYLAFSLGSTHAVRALFLGNPGIVVALLVAVGLLLVVRDQYGPAGVFFGLSIIKPQMVVLLLPFVLIWAVSRRRMGLVWSMLVTVLLLVGGSIYFFPRWILFHYNQLTHHLLESFPASPNAILAVWFPGSEVRLMGFVAIGLGIWLIVEWWRAMGKDSRWFLWTSALTLVITQLIGLPTSLSDHVILLIPFVLVFSTWAQRWRVGGTRLSLVVMVLVAGVEWLLVWLTMDFSLTAKPAHVMYFFVPVVTLSLLYWARYWALHSIRLKVSHIEALRKL